MGGKSLVLLGLIAGGLYTYFCINTHKDQLYAKLYPSSTPTVAEEKVITNNLEEVNLASEDSVDLGAEKVVSALEVAMENNNQEELQSAEQMIQKLEESTQKRVEIEKDGSSFYFLNESPYTFNASLAEEQTESEMIKEINQFCQTKECSNDIKFLDSVKEETWSKDALSIVHYLADNDIKNGSLSIKDGVLKVTGQLKDAQSKEGIQNLLNAFGNTMQIEDETKIEEVVTPDVSSVKVEEVITPDVSSVKVEEVVMPDVSSIKVEEVVTPDVSSVKVEKEIQISAEDQIRQAQSEINILLQNSVINFKVNSSEIVPASREILDSVISIVNRLNIDINVDVFGHTDASGSKKYNKKLSQKRANSVKKYLINNGMNVSTLIAIGNGEENLIFAPYDKRNRRVEIYLTKGE